jgi:PAS domain S-box-containing protein
MSYPDSLQGTLEEVLQTHGLAWGGVADQLLDASKAGCAVLDRDLVVLFANRRAREMVGVRPGTALSVSVPEIQAQVERVRAGAEDPGGDPLLRGTSSFLARVSRLGPGLPGILCVFLDRTRSESAAREVRAYEELTRQQDAIIDSLSEGLWITDSHGTVLRVNPASERLNLLKADQVVGRNVQDLMDEGIFDRSATLEVLRRKAPVSMLQNCRGRKLVLTGIPVLDQAGEIMRVVVTEQDITEIDALHQELEEKEAMRERLRDRIVEMQIEEVESSRFIAKSPCMQKALRHAIKVSTVDSTVLLQGESGVGKELFADIIYKYSERAGKPLVKINCGAIPEPLLEAELFGYEKGAFTGAQAKGKPGFFELADGGIIFLDEIAELTLASQVKLLRFLEDGRVTRVGATQSRKLNVRIVAATHQDLRTMVDRGSFRLDLYYRLSVIPIHIPPLRERTDCILPLLHHYLDRFSARMGVTRRITRAASEVLLAYPWRGNVRELANLCERLVVMSETELIGLADLPADILGQAGKAALAQAGPQLTLNQALENTERTLLQEARQRHGNQALMAKALGIDQSTVARKLKKYGLA